MAPNATSVVIVAARRTPIGAFQGRLASLTAPELGAAAIRAAVADAGLEPDAASETMMGCCLLSGLKQAPARQASLGAGLAVGVPATTISKVCGSGMMAAMLGHDRIVGGAADIVVAGGMESMSNSPYLLAKVRGGLRLGHGAVLDHMFSDGLEDAYEGRLMGHYADLAAERCGVTRAEQDAYAARSVRRAQAAVREGCFAAEVTPFDVTTRKGSQRIDADETPGQRRADGLELLKPVFNADGTVTAGNASTISDGAAAMVLMRASEAERRGLTPLARFVAHSTEAREPGEYPFAPAGAVRKVLAKADWELRDVDLFEINEAFATVALVASRALGLDDDRLNIQGGACALGHPIGATGARIMVTLIHAMRRRGARRGVAALCIGGGEATAVALELV